MIWSQEIRNDKPLYLTTNKSGWPPGSRHPIQKSAALSDRPLPAGRGWVSYPNYVGNPLSSRCGPTEKPCLRWPELFENCQGIQTLHTHRVSNGKTSLSHL